MLLLTGKIGRAYLVRNFFVYVPEGRNSLHFFKLGAWLAGMLITFFRSERPHYAQRCFILKTHQMLSVHTTPEEVENLTITGHFWFMFAKNLVRELRFQPVLYLHEMKSRHFQIPQPSGLKSAGSKSFDFVTDKCGGNPNHWNKTAFQISSDVILVCMLPINQLVLQFLLCSKISLARKCRITGSTQSCWVGRE